MNGVIIRQSTKKDAEKIQDVLIRSHRFTYRKLFSDAAIKKIIDQYYNLDRLMEEITSISTRWHGYIIAEEDDNILGVIGGGMRDEIDGEVYVLYLAPESRNKGIGTLLLNHFTNIQKFTYGAEEQWVAVAKGNHYAILFYEAKGFIFQYESPSYAALSERDVSLWYKRQI